MTTFNTGNPIGSTDARDLSDNAENFDRALGTLEATWIDRFGVTRDSFEGRLEKGSFYRVGTFAAGYTLTNMRQTLEYSGHEYSWVGSFPKNVAAGATPATSGGIGAGAWVDRTDETLRGELAGQYGSKLVGGAVVVVSDIMSVDATGFYDGLSVFAKTRLGNHGGGGMFIYTQSTALSVDNAFVFNVTTGTGRLTRILSGDFIHSDFAGIEGSSDETSKFQSLINYALSNGIKNIYVKSDSEFTVTSLSNSSLVNFIGENSRFSKWPYVVISAKKNGQFILPDGFYDYFPAGKVIGYHNGIGFTEYDLNAYLPAGTKTYYVRATGGSDANSGLTYATALSTIAAAIAKADVDIIMLEPAEYQRIRGVWSASPTRDIKFKVMGGGRATILGSDLGVAGEYNLDATYTSTYKRTRSSVASVFDKKYTDINGDWLEYSNVASAALVNTTPGSWYADGTSVWVRCLDDRAPDDNLRVNLSTTCTISGAVKCYFENITFAGVSGGLVARYVSGRPTILGRGCEFKYSYAQGGGFRSEGADSFFVDCLAARNRYDGFNYHNDYNNTSTFPARSFELRCVGRHNGTTRLGNNNGSTSHDTGSMAIRVNCTYFENDGPNCVDVDSAKSVNIGVDCYNTRKVSESRNYESGPNSTMYLIGCRSHGRRNYDAIVSSGELRYYDLKLDSVSGLTSSLKQFNPFYDFY